MFRFLQTVLNCNSRPFAGAKYRDIYPKEFYDRMVRRNLCVRETFEMLHYGAIAGLQVRS